MEDLEVGTPAGRRPSPAFWQGKTVLLTGHTGFKGSWMTVWLEALGARTVGYALPPPAEGIFTQCGIARLCDDRRGDLADLAALRALMAETQPDVIIHNAAQPLVLASYDDPAGTFATNVTGTLNVLEAARGLEKPCAILTVTTDKVYENLEWPWSYRENDRLGAGDPYSSSKACAEIVVATWRQAFFARRSVHMPLVAARAGNVFGGGDWSADRLIPDIVRATVRQQPLTLRHPDAVRPWQHVLDPICGYLVYAEAAYRGEAGLPEVLNFGPSGAQIRRVRDVVAAFEDGFPGLRIGFEASDRKEAGFLLLESGLAQRSLGWSPRIGWRAAVDATAEWYRAALDGAASDEMLALTRRQIATLMG